MLHNLQSKTTLHSTQHNSPAIEIEFNEAQTEHVHSGCLFWTSVASTRAPSRGAAGGGGKGGNVNVLPGRRMNAKRKWELNCRDFFVCLTAKARLRTGFSVYLTSSFAPPSFRSVQNDCYNNNYNNHCHAHSRSDSNSVSVSVCSRYCTCTFPFSSIPAAAASKGSGRSRDR